MQAEPFFVAFWPWLSARCSVKPSVDRYRVIEATEPL